jgi:small subunit ribosomal protein S17
MARKKDEVTEENEQSPGDAEETQAAPQDAEAAEAAAEAGQEADEPIETLVPEAAADAPAEEAPAADSSEDEPGAVPADPASDEAAAEAVAAEPAAEVVEADAAAEDAEAEVSPPVGGDTPDVPAVEPKRKKKRLPRALRPQRSKPKRTQTGRKKIVRLEKPEHPRGRRQERQGVVVSDAMDKTIVVKVDMIKAHPRYQKVVRRSVKFHAHDEQNEAKVGDVVRIVETRPLSANKRWRLVEIVEAAK